MNSYSLEIKRLNQEADQSLLGVKLGAYCIENGVPVNTVARELVVSRSIVYRWFKGQGDISFHLRSKVEAYIDSLMHSEQK